MTKPIEPSKAARKAWDDARDKWCRVPREDYANTAAARIIQRHVDREVRKALKKSKQESGQVMIETFRKKQAKTRKFMDSVRPKQEITKEQDEVLKCAEKFAESYPLWADVSMIAGSSSFGRFQQARRMLENAVNAMKEGKG